MFFLLASFLLLAQSLAQDSNCDFQQYVQATQRYIINSLNYPYSYPRSSTCRWIAECPKGYLCRVDCYLEIPLTSGCSGDRFLISRTGDPQLNNAESYCGRQTLTGILSVSTKLSLASIVTSNSAGGRFSCNLTAQVAPQPACKCGIRKQDRIVGGTQTGVNEYPMMAGLIENSIDQILCGGAIISERFILTAAHCLSGLKPSGITVSVGNRDLFKGIKFNVTKFTIHPNFNPNTYDFDVAILTLAKNITMTGDISSGCLPFKYQNRDLTGVNITLLGWGTIFFGGPTSTILLKTDVTIISQAECRMSGAITDRQVCSKTPGKDACQNDSGGPGQYTDPMTARLFIFGIVSFGDGCGSTRPAVHTRVTSTEILRWIVDNAPAYYCVVE